MRPQDKPDGDRYLFSILYCQIKRPCPKWTVITSSSSWVQMAHNLNGHVPTGRSKCKPPRRPRMTTSGIGIGLPAWFQDKIWDEDVRGPRFLDLHEDALNEDRVGGEDVRGCQYLKFLRLPRTRTVGTVPGDLDVLRRPDVGGCPRHLLSGH